MSRTAIKSQRTVILEQLHLSVRKSISRHELDHIAKVVEADGMSWLRDEWADDMVLRLHAAVWTANLKEEKISFPTTWWDAVKLRFFPRWALRRWPAQMEVVVITSGTKFPKLPSLGEGVPHATYYRYPIIERGEAIE